MSVQLKTAEDIAGMREAGRLASELLDHLTPMVAAGVTTKEIDRAAHDYMVNVQKTVPATLNYAPPGHSPYPASLCTSVNHVVCHGIPSEKKLKDGDIINIDVTVIKDGYHGDTSRMFLIGKASIQARRLVEVTYEAMWRGIRAVRPGAHLGDIGATIQKFAEGHGFSVVREFCGHGIGKQFHEDPPVLHYGRAGSGPKLQNGMIFAIEPLVYAKRLLLIDLPQTAMLCVLAVFVQTVSPNKYVGYLFVVIDFLGTMFLDKLGFEHLLYRYGETPQPQI